MKVSVATDVEASAEHVGLLIPPLMPLQVQLQGPSPLGTTDAVPEAQRPVVGALGKMPVLLTPHMPFSTAR